MSTPAPAAAPAPVRARVHVHAVQRGKKKDGSGFYFYQKVEVQQTPSFCNEHIQVFCKEDAPLPIGPATAAVHFYPARGDGARGWLASFSDYQPA